MLLTEGQIIDHKGAALMLPALPPARELIGDRGYDSGWFRTGLAARAIKPCIPSTRSRKSPVPYDKALYRERHHSRTPSAGSRIGAGSHPVTIAAPTPLLGNLHRSYRHLLLR